MACRLRDKFLLHANAEVLAIAALFLRLALCGWFVRLANVLHCALV